MWGPSKHTNAILSGNLKLKTAFGLASSSDQTTVYISGEVGEAVQHARTIRRQIRMAQTLEKADLRSYAKELQVPFDLLKRTVELGRLPVIFFAAAGVGKQDILCVCV